MMPHAPQSPVSVLIHPTQFPGAVEEAMNESLRSREMNHKFHYDTPKQTLRWLRIHEAFSPARTDVDCLRIYGEAFAACAASWTDLEDLEVVSLGCGGGQKDAQLLGCLRERHPRARLRYLPVDVSSGLALTARSAALAVGLDAADVVPLVVDLAQVSDWTAALAGVLSGDGPRVICFFGMLPNFLPSAVMPQLAALLRPHDLLLVSANLAPGSDYRQGVHQVLPLYDNLPTREWLESVLMDLGLERDDAGMAFQVVDHPLSGDLLRIESRLTFMRPCQLSYAGVSYRFLQGDTFRLFFSYRHTPDRLDAQLAPHGVRIRAGWTNQSGEEGVFLCGREVLMDRFTGKG